VKYRVHIADRELTVEIDGERVRVDGEEVAVGPGKLDGEIEVLIGSRALRLRPVPAPAAERAEGSMIFLLDGRIVRATVESSREALSRRVRPLTKGRGPETLRSQIPGIIRQIFKAPDDPVQAGETILTLEAMKMENEVRASRDGTVRTLHVEVGQVVAAGADLVIVEPTDD